MGYPVELPHLDFGCSACLACGSLLMGRMTEGRAAGGPLPLGLPAQGVAVSSCSSTQSPRPVQLCGSVLALLSGVGPWTVGAMPGMMFVIGATFQARPTQPLSSSRQQASRGSLTWRLAKAHWVVPARLLLAQEPVCSGSLLSAEAAVASRARRNCPPARAPRSGL